MRKYNKGNGEMGISTGIHWSPAIASCAGTKPTGRGGEGQVYWIMKSKTHCELLMVQICVGSSQ